MRDSRSDTGLIIGYWDRYLRDTLSKRLEYRVQPRMGDTDRGLFQQFQLWRLFYDDGVARNRSDLLGIDLFAHGKHELQIFMLCQGSYNGPKDIDPAIQDRSHRSVYQRFPSYSFPREIDVLSAFAVMEWTGVMEL